MGKKKKIVLPPELPEEAEEEEIEVSEEDIEFVKKNKKYAGFVSRLDTKSITRHVSRVADVEEEALEAIYEEKRLLKSKKNKKDEEEDDKEKAIEVDSLPVKTLDGLLYYRNLSEEKSKEDGDGGEGDKGGIVRMSKVEKRVKLKKSKKEAKKKHKDEVNNSEEVWQTTQAAVLAEVKEDLTAEETFENKKRKLAELGIALLADPESNIKLLKDMLQICKDDDHHVVKLGLLSLSAVFKDVIPGYRIRLPTEKELEMKVSKEVKKMRYYESTLLSAYKAYLQKLMAFEKDSKYKHVVVRCLCTLLEAVPHFNFRENLLTAVVTNVGSSDDVIRKLCCSTIKSLFTNEGKHGGEATVEAVRLIADLVKAHNCQLHPDSVEVFIALSFDEDIGKAVKAEWDNKMKNKKNKKRKNAEEPSQLQENDRKKSRKELMTQLRKEVAADYKAASFAPDVVEQRQMQSETLAAVFEIYFRVLKHAMQSVTSSSEADSEVTSSASASNPLLVPCLNGLGKFSHLIDLDYIGDLFTYLKRLTGGMDSHGSSVCPSKLLSVSERLQCCIVAFKVMRNNLDALNVDLQGFFVQLYNLLFEYRPGRDRGEVLAEALRIMLCEDRQHDMQKAAAFVKRLATFSLCFGSAESVAALVTLKHLLQKNVKCRSLLENDAGGGSVSGFIAKYQPYASDPNLSGALASVLWELNLLSKHHNPVISTLASGISTMATAHNQVHMSATSPQQAFADLSFERELLNPKFDSEKPNIKRKKGSARSKPSSLDTLEVASANEEELKQKFTNHFKLLLDFKENERIRDELHQTTLKLRLYDEYKNKKQKKKAKEPNIRIQKKSISAA